MKNKQIVVRWMALVVAAALIGIDQWIKYLAVTYLAPIQIFPLWDGVFQLTYVENSGAAFGMLSGKTFILVGVTGLVLLGLIVAILLGKVKSNFLVWSLALIIGGGVGNLIDRIALGYVVDYLHVTLIDFAVFNFADCCVVVGTILLVIYFLFLERQAVNQQSIENAEKKVVTPDEI